MAGNRANLMETVNIVRDRYARGHIGSFWLFPLHIHATTAGGMTCALSAEASNWRSTPDTVSRRVD